MEESKNPSNVKSITSISKAVLPSGHKTWTLPLIEQNLFRYLEQLKRLGRLETVFPDFYGRLRIFRPHPMDIETVLELSEDLELRTVAPPDLDSMVIKFFMEVFSSRYDDHAFSASTQLNLSSILISFCQKLTIDQIKIFAFKSEHIISWRKLPFDLFKPSVFGIGPDYALSQQGSGLTLPPIELGDAEALLSEHTPAWESLLSTCSNRLAVIAWLGSLMDRSRTNTQFLYLYGEGNDGKGTLMKALAAIFQDKLMFQGQIPIKDAGALRFFSENLEGKLLLGCSEYPEAELFGSYMKALTGGDALQIEPKGKKSRNAVNHLKVYISSNWRAQIPNTPAARRRIIYGEMESVPVEKIILDFEHKLVYEADFFFSIAYYVYRSMKYLNRLTQDESVYKHNYEASNENALSSILNAFFVYKLTEAQFEDHPRAKNLLPHMSVSSFEDYCRTHFPLQKPERIRTTLQEYAGVAYSRKLSLGKNTKLWCYMGISPRRMGVMDDGPRIDPSPVVDLLDNFEVDDKL